MLWRAHQGGWATAKARRKRHFDEEQLALQRDIANHFGGTSLGNARADVLLHQFRSETLSA